LFGEIEKTFRLETSDNQILGYRLQIKEDCRSVFFFKYENKFWEEDCNTLRKFSKVILIILPIKNASFDNLPYLFAIRIGNVQDQCVQQKYQELEVKYKKLQQRHKKLRVKYQNLHQKYQELKWQTEEPSSEEPLLS